MGNEVAAAVVHRNVTKTTRLPNKASIFRAELHAISLALPLIRRSKEKNFIIFSDSISGVVLYVGILAVGVVFYFLILIQVPSFQLSPLPAVVPTLLYGRGLGVLRCVLVQQTVKSLWSFPVIFLDYIVAC